MRAALQRIVAQLAAALPTRTQVAARVHARRGRGFGRDPRNHHGAARDRDGRRLPLGVQPAGADRTRLRRRAAECLLPDRRAERRRNGSEPDRLEQRRGVRGEPAQGRDVADHVRLGRGPRHLRADDGALHRRGLGGRQQDRPPVLPRRGRPDAAGERVERLDRHHARLALRYQRHAGAERRPLHDHDRPQRAGPQRDHSPVRREELLHRDPRRLRLPAEREPSRARRRPRRAAAGCTDRRARRARQPPGHPLLDRWERQRL